MDGSREPSADHRILAQAMFSLYNAMRLEGFTEHQACLILGTWTGTVSSSGNGDGEDD